MLILAPIVVWAATAADPEPRSILQASADACKAVSSLRCSATHVYTIADQEERTDRALVTLERLASDKKVGAKARIDFGHPRTVVTYAYDGQGLRTASHETKRLTIRRPEDNPASPIINNIAGKIVTDNPILRTSRLTNALKDGKELSLAGMMRIDGQDCDAVRVAFPDSEEIVEYVVTFYIARSYHLPRRADTRYRFPERSTPDSFSLTLTDLVVNPSLDDATFAFPTPEGYTDEVFSPTPTPEPLPLGRPAPEFSHQDPAGKMHTLSEYRGKVVVLDFWGTWCGPCVKALPTLQTIHEEFKDKGVVVIGLSCNEPRNADPARMFEQKRISYQLLLDGSKTAKEYRVTAFPTLLVLDPEGKIVDRHIGLTAELADELRASLRKHVGVK